MGKDEKTSKHLLGLSSIVRLEARYLKAMAIHEKDALLGISAAMSPALQRKYPDA
jgi:hypothetical protein|tara:strand:- start:2360 stop:2524 length:165 start_codon:yes stop_codon:yes gene_type:complete